MPVYVKPGYEILSEISEGGIKELKLIERAGRVCYKSEDRITQDGESAKKFVAMLIRNGHEAMLEHSSLSVRFVCDRGVTHELVRHRLCAFAQESTRYCNYTADKFGSVISVIAPPWLDKPGYEIATGSFRMNCSVAEAAYFGLIKEGLKPQDARGALPTALKTEIVVTANYREWRHIFQLRTDTAAHPQIRELLTPLLAELKTKIPVVFDNITVPEG